MKMNEYDGESIKNDLSEEVFSLAFYLGNHFYDNYSDLKSLIGKIIELDNDSISLIISSITDLHLYKIEENNQVATKSFNKRVFDFCSIMCALKDCGYDLSLLKDKKNNSLYISYLSQARVGLMKKIQNKMDIMITNPLDFNYSNSLEDDATVNRRLISNTKINGIELCNLMNYLLYPQFKNLDIIKCGNYVADNPKILVK